MTKTRILVADDYEVVREGIRVILEKQPGWEVVAEAVNGREAVDKAKQLKPDVVVLDIGMPVLNGLEATSFILKQVPQIEVLILTFHESEQMFRDALNAGARGYLMKSDLGSELVAAVEALSMHKSYFTSKVSEFILDAYVHPGESKAGHETSHDRLTPREHETIQLLAEGKSNKEVAVALGINVKTVESHRANIMHKLGFHSLCEVVHYAIRNKIVKA